MPESKGQAGVQKPGIVMQAQQIILQRVQFYMPEGAFDVYLIDFATLTQQPDTFHYMINCGQFEQEGGVKINILGTTSIYRPTLGKGQVHYDPPVF